MRQKLRPVRTPQARAPRGRDTHTRPTARPPCAMATPDSASRGVTVCARVKTETT